MLYSTALSAVPVEEGMVVIDHAFAPTLSQKRQLHYCENKLTGKQY